MTRTAATDGRRPSPDRPARELARAVAAGAVSASDIVTGALEGIRRDELNAFLSVADDAASLAAEIDVAVRSGRETGPLAGVPVAVKDNICTLGLPTTCASRILDGFVSPYEATAVRRLRTAGAVIMGKTNLDEFGMGSSTENSAYGPTRNPLEPDRVPGGSSGGSAAAVAAGMVPLALGSETGGSVRQPASFCGIVGVKPTYGLVSRYGLVAFASSLDQIGVFARNVDDASLLLEAISGPDARDSTAADRTSRPLAPPPVRDARGLVVGVPGEYFPPELDSAITGLCRAALDRLASAGAELREISLPHTRYALPAYYLIAPAEASANLARYDGVRYGARWPAADSTRAVYEETRSRGFGDEVKRRIMLGTYALSAGYYDRFYGRAQRVRALIARDFQQAFRGGVDVIFTPTTPGTAFRLGERKQDPYTMYLSDVFTVTANLAGLPAVSLPVGTADGLPVGAQLIAGRWQEPRMLMAAAALERALLAQ